MGGGGPSVPPDNSLQLEREREQFQVQQQAQAKADKLEQDQLDETNFQNNLSAARSSALNRTRSAFTTRGLDASSFDQAIQDAVNGVASGIPDKDPNPSNFFGPNFADTVINNLQTEKRAAGASKVAQAFTPGFEQSALPDTAGQGFVDSILNDQYNNAFDELTRARARGTLNDTGFNSGISLLGQQKSAATAKANDLATAVLGTDRSKLSQVSTDASNAANAFTLGQPDFSVDPYTQRLQTTENTINTNLPGQINDAVGGNQFFDIGSLIQRAGTAQGAQNTLGDQSVAAVLAQRQRDQQQSRGLGTTGQF